MNFRTRCKKMTPMVGIVGLMLLCGQTLAADPMQATKPEDKPIFLRVASNDPADAKTFQCKCTDPNTKKVTTASCSKGQTCSCVGGANCTK